MSDPTPSPNAASDDATHDSGAGQWALVPHTSLLGELVIPHGAGRADELEDLAQRATQYAVPPVATAHAAPTAPPGRVTSLGATTSAASRSPATRRRSRCMRSA